MKDKQQVGSKDKAGIETEKTFASKSKEAGTGLSYIGGFYRFFSGNDNFAVPAAFGNANEGVAAHFFIVNALHPGGGDTTITVSGTSITDEGVRTGGDSEVITVPSGEAADSYFETTLKWLGDITITKTAGPNVECNYGFVKYWDNNNTNYRVKGIDFTWLGGANDAAFNVKLLHHKATGWTYNVGSTPSPPAAIADMSTDYVTEDNVVVDEQGAWKRDNLDTFVNGAGEEGVIIEFTIGAAKAINLGNFLLRIRP